MVIFKDFLAGIFGYLILLVMVLIGVAFLTLLERKVLGYIQLRKGPNKVGYIGLLQPFSDAVKLFRKETTFPYLSNYLVYYFSPIFSFSLIFFIWLLIPYLWLVYRFDLGMLYFLTCMSLGVYGIIVAGWSSNSNYALIGGLRAIAQTISYEVRLSFIFFCLLVIFGRLSFIDYFYMQNYIWFIFFNFPLFIILFTSMLAETNRTPFDFAEGESELVSGFNVEYRRGGFALIFLAEYSRILFISLVIRIFFLGGNFISFIFLFCLVFLSYVFIWLRGTLPRYRYDKLIDLCWRSYLPFVLLIIIFYFCLKYFFFVIIL